MKKTFIILVAFFSAITCHAQTTCNVCNGYGKIVCRACGGNGVVLQNYFDPFWGVWQTVSYNCVYCWGKGAVTCVTCGGRGAIATNPNNTSFQASPPVYHLEDKNKKCYHRSTHFETYKAGSYQIVLSDKCVNCNAQYRNH